MHASTSLASSTAHRLVAVGFLIAISLPIARWAFPGDPDPGTQLVENRTPAPLPRWPLSQTDWEALPRGLEAYWSDAFGFRDLLLRGNAIVNASFGISPNPSVILARDGWLFYAGESVIDQWRGTQPLSDSNLAEYSTMLEARRTWLSRRGAHFLFVVAPEKSTVYPELVPARFGPPARTPTDQLLEYLHAHTQVDVLDLRQPVKEARARGDVFLRTDTHWSDRGAFAGYRALMQRLAQWFPTVKARTEADFSQQQSAPFIGDLGLMLGNLDRERSETSEQWVTLAPPPSRITATQSAPPGSQNYAEYESAADRPRAVVFHDSFFLESEERVPSNRPRPSWAPLPQATFRPRDLLAEQFSRAVFSWQHGFDVSLIKREHPDVVIEEQVERYLTSGLGGELPSE